MDIGGLLRTSAALPLRTAVFGVKATASVAATSLNIATTGATVLASAGVDLVTTPLRNNDNGAPSAIESGIRMALEGFGGEPVRRCNRSPGRVWLEVRGLGEPGGRKIGAAVLAAARAHPGVDSAYLNYPLSRLLIRLGDHPPSHAELCALVSEAERSARPRAAGASRRSPLLPVDGGLLSSRVIGAAITAGGLYGAAVGRALRLPRLPLVLGASVSVFIHQPALRRLLEDRLGADVAEQVLSAASLVSRIAGQVPASLSVSLVSRLVGVVETRASQRAWAHHEPRLARYADCPDVLPKPEPSHPRGSVEQHIDRSAAIQAVAAVLGLGTAHPGTAASAALAAVPKAARSTRELFASTFARGMANEYAALALHPGVWRRLDRVDAIVVDPRALCCSELQLGGIRGAAEQHRTAVWERAQARLEAGTLSPGWRVIEGPWDRIEEQGDDGQRSEEQPVEVQVRHAHQPLASAVVAEARRSGAQVVSVNTVDIGELRSAFDDLYALNGSIDAALCDAVTALHDAGRTVAMISSAATAACLSADVAIGVLVDACPPTWCSDVLVDDLSAVWRILHALPAARSASRRGVELATGASLLGALLLVPGVRGRGPGPVTAGAVVGQWTGYRLARQVLRDPAPEPVPVGDWHAMSPEQVRRRLPTRPPRSSRPHHSRINPGIALGRTAGRLQRSVTGFAGAMRAELADPLTPVLATGAAASAVLGSPVDAVLVGSVLTGNAALAAAQRIHSERTLQRLLNVQLPKARTVLGYPDCAADYATVPSDRLRPGDIIEVRTDEVVPADARLLDATDVEADESSLTGESLPVAKQVDATPGAPLAERSCMVFAGSTVVTGTAVAVVTAVGTQTQANRAAELAHGQIRDVGLQTQLRRLTDRVWPISLAGGAVVTALGLLHRTPLRDAVSSGVAVSVAAVPEGLPLVATLAQQASARRLTKLGALVRSPHSVEALGRVDVVCFDKTGTLSQNRLRVTTVNSASGRSAADVLACAAVAAPPADRRRHQHATDTAIVAAAADGGIDTSPDLPTAHLAFRPGRPFSASVTGATLSVKGAPEVVLDGCAVNDRAQVDWAQRTVHDMAQSGLRVIAVASRELTADQVVAAGEDPDVLAQYCVDGLQLVGLLGLADTPRDEAAAVLTALAGHDIAVRLITGDHPATAAAIAAELGLPVTEDQVIGGSDWEDMSRRDQEQAVADHLVFARMSPEQKVQIVQTLERTGRVCAMVGDGVNDAAAIRTATVGIGVAARGSAPARMASDVMLLDGRIEALLDALDEGRQLWQRVRAAVAVLLGGNTGEVLFAVISSAITGRALLNTRQLLLVNMLTDALPAAALAISPPTDGNGSVAHDESHLWRTVGVRGVATAGAATAAWLMARATGRDRRAATVALVALVAAQLGQTMLDSHGRPVVLTAVGSLAAMGVVISTPGLSQLLGCTPLGPVGWAQALSAASVATGAAALAPSLLDKAR